uniref:GATOR complex protein NPRL3 n=1 Tax=Ditylenchus dipsaci TaxID=166011 RepID=A0A915ESY5_9BILA
MATLDEKFLDGPNVGYCSSSDEETGLGDGDTASNTPSGVASNRKQTGPKAVLADYHTAQHQMKVKQRKAELEMIKEAKRFTLQNPSSSQKQSDSSDDDEDLESIRRRRMQQLKSLSRGRILEIPDAEEFLSVIENNKSSSYLFIHIYRDGLDSCNTLNEALLELTSKFPRAKFFKVQAHLLGTSGFFTSNALPALQIYRNGDLIGNFVRITDHIGEDFSSAQLLRFLTSNDIEPSDGMQQSAYSPQGVILVSKDDSAERVLFMYPFTAELPVVDKEEDCTKDWKKTDDNIADQTSPAICAASQNAGSLLCPKEGLSGVPFEIKVDNIRFAGFPWRIENSTHSLAVVFVLPGSAESHIVDSFQKLSKKIAIAINSEQQRCNYLKLQIQLMQPAWDEYEALTDEQKATHSPYPAILEKSGLCQHLKEVFEDVCDYGMCDVFVDDCIEVGFCVEPKAFLQAGLAPKSNKEVEEIMKQVCPYHGILFLEDCLPSPDSNPFVLKFLEKYEANLSIEELSASTGLPLLQVLQIVKHYLLWARAIVIYPICSTNVYTTTPCHTSFTTMVNTFSEQFEGCGLAEIVEQFSPPSSLGSFLADSSLYSPVNLRMQMLIFLLRNQLLVQLHTYLYLLPPISNTKIEGCDPSCITPRINTVIKSVNGVTEELRGYLTDLCGQAILSGVPELEVFYMVQQFVKFIPFLNGRHHIEHIMFETQTDRSNLQRVMDLFAPILSPLYIEGI